MSSKLEFTHGTGFSSLLSDAAQARLVQLTEAFQVTRSDLLQKRNDRFRSARLIGYAWTLKPESERVRLAAWKASVRSDEHMNAPDTFVDFEDGLSPLWDHRVEAAQNLDRSMAWFRPRGIHMEEKSILLAGRPLPAAWVDLVIWLESRRENKGHFGVRIPKLETAFEARFWSDVLFYLEDLYRLPRASIRAALEVETVFGAIECEEMIFELKDRISWMMFDPLDYAFHWIKILGHQQSGLLPVMDAEAISQWLAPVLGFVASRAEKRGVHFLGSDRSLQALEVPFVTTPGWVTPSEKDVERMLRDCLRFLDRWLQGDVVFPLARFELDRCQLWQWVRFQAVLTGSERLSVSEYLRIRHLIVDRELESTARLFDSFILNSNITEYSVPAALNYAESSLR